jgi:hypothetical protein
LKLADPPIWILEILTQRIHMKKDTLAKWFLACTALAFAYACQPKTPTPQSQAPAQTEESQGDQEPVTNEGSEAYDDSAAAPKPADPAAEPESVAARRDFSMQVIEFEEPAKVEAEPTAASAEIPVGACGCTKQSTKKGSSDSDEGSNMGSPTGGDDTSKADVPVVQEPAVVEQASAVVESDVAN